MLDQTRGSLSSRCDELLLSRALLAHPWYVAWTEGRLPVTALREYAREYGAFIVRIARGWSAAGEQEIARIEDEHARIWNDSFAGALGTAISEPRTPEVIALVQACDRLFSGPHSSLGALYAFEAQQPAIARAKCRGLDEHYAHLPSKCAQYFRLHELDDGEPALLASKMDRLSGSQEDAAVDGCRQMSQALHDALTGLQAAYAPGI